MPTSLNPGQGAGFMGPMIRDVMRRYGLTGMDSWISHGIVNGWSQEEFLLKIYDTKIFQNRFPAIFELQRKGQNAPSPEEYVQYENRSREMTQMIGFRISQNEINDLIANNVALPELEERIQLAATAFYSSDIETRRKIQDFYDVSDGDMMRYWLDPKKELPRLQQQLRMAEIAGAAKRVAYGDITTAQAARLESAGMDRESAAEGFTSLDLAKELFVPLDEVEGLIDQDMQVEFLAGNTDIKKQVEKRAERRKAQFEGGGDYQAGEDELGTGKFATGSAR